MPKKMKLRLALPYGIKVKNIRHHKKGYEYKLYAPAGWTFPGRLALMSNFHQRTRLQELRSLTRLVKK